MLWSLTGSIVHVRLPLFLLLLSLSRPCSSLEATVAVADLLSGLVYGDELNLFIASILPNPIPTNIWSLCRLMRFSDYDFANHLAAQTSLPPDYLSIALNLPREMLPLRPLLRNEYGRRWFLTHLTKLQSPIGGDDLRLRHFSSTDQATILRHIYHHQTQHRASVNWCRDLNSVEEYAEPAPRTGVGDETEVRTERIRTEIDRGAREQPLGPGEDGSRGQIRSSTMPLLMEPDLWLLYDAPCHLMRQKHGRPILSTIIHLIEALAGDPPVPVSVSTSLPTSSSFHRPPARQPCWQDMDDDDKDGNVEPRDRLLARLRCAFITGVNMQTPYLVRGYSRVRRIPRDSLEVAFRCLMEGGELPGNVEQIDQIWETIVKALETVIGDERVLLAAIKFELMAHLLTLFPALHSSLLFVLEKKLLEVYAPTEVSPYAVRQVLAPLRRLPSLPSRWRKHIAEHLLPVLQLPLAGGTLDSWEARVSWWRKNMLGMRLRGNRPSWHARAMIYLNDQSYPISDPGLVTFGENENKGQSTNELGDEDITKYKSQSRVSGRDRIKRTRFACIDDGRIIDKIASMWWQRMVDFARGQRPSLPQLPQVLLALMRKRTLGVSDFEKLRLDGTVSKLLSVSSLCIPDTNSEVALRKIIRALYMIYQGLQLGPYGLLQ